MLAIISILPCCHLFLTRAVYFADSGLSCFYLSCDDRFLPCIYCQWALVHVRCLGFHWLISYIVFTCFVSFTVVVFNSVGRLLLKTVTYAARVHYSN